MSQPSNNSHWPGRITGAITIGLASYVLLWFWNSWGLSETTRLFISLALGLLFLILGGNIWRWLDIIDWTS